VRDFVDRGPLIVGPKMGGNLEAKGNPRGAPCRGRAPLNKQAPKWALHLKEQVGLPITSIALKCAATQTGE